jgi:tRNA threonylcarbamoyladenosine biosynthesis protein TsaE
MEATLRTEAELVKEAEELARSLVPALHARVVALQGDLGAGKTTFTQAFAKALGVDEHVTSPTYVIEKRYPLANQKFAHLIHIDAYRLTDADELRKLDWERTVNDAGNLIIVEWADKVAALIPEDAVRITLAYVDETTRSISYGN